MIGMYPPVRVEPAYSNTSSHWAPFSNTANAVYSTPDCGFWEDTFKAQQPLKQERKRKWGMGKEATGREYCPGVEQSQEEVDLGTQMSQVSVTPRTLLFCVPFRVEFSYSTRRGGMLMPTDHLHPIPLMTHMCFQGKRQAQPASHEFP